jgi:RNA polymerase sigma-70 factor (ECF subfamily)
VTVTGSGQVAADPTDLDLVRLAQSGDLDAFGQLVERNRRAVFRAALAAVGSATEADDVAQEAFVSAWRKLSGFRGDSQFRTWLLSITWRKAMDRRKGISRWLKLAASPSTDDAGNEAFDVMERVASIDRGQDAALEAGELQAQIKKLIATLPQKLREALLLAGSGDHTYDEISEMLGAPVGTVKWRVAEARRVLRRKLAAIGYGNED